MSVPGPPPEGDGVDDVDSTRFWHYTSDPTADDAHRQDTLVEMVERTAAPDRRWLAVLLLRVVRMRLHDVEIDSAAILRLARGRYGDEMRSVLRVGRLSEVAVQLGVERIAKYPEHIDIDWYGDNPPHWWNTRAFTGGEAERKAATGHLRHLEKSFGFKNYSNLHPAGWVWPEDVGQTLHWADKVNDSDPPRIADGYAKLRIDWHYGELPTDFDYTWDGPTFWFSTPAVTHPDILHAGVL